MNNPQRSLFHKSLGGLIFFSRWLQAPLYLGLIIAQAIYVYQFFVELFHLIAKVVYSGSDAAHPPITEAVIMTSVLGLIDVVMIANLLIMVIVGGYETFVSRLRLEGHPDQPEWLSHVNAGVLKVKLATALIGISSIHLLRTFIAIGNPDTSVTSSDVFWQIMVHLTFVVSALLLAWTDKISTSAAAMARSKAH